MHKLNDGKLNQYGSLAYVPQQAWIQNATVKNNILFNLDYNESKYLNVIEACSLKHDLQIMPAGDLTEIGEKGINLSGGQKQRVSLARSIYSSADIYLLDDPLSAVDSHVGKNIFDLAIGPNGLLNNKTRLFVTNSLNYLPQVDEIIMIDNGEIVQIGTYDNLKNENTGYFSDFIKNYLNKANSNSENETIEIDLNDEDDDNDLEPVELKKTISVRRSSSKKPNEKIIEKEKVESGSVKLSVIFEYLKACRIWLSLIFLILFITSELSDLFSDFWLKDWSDETQKNADSALKNKYFRLFIYALLGFMYCFIGFLKNLCFVGMFIKATKLLHDKLLISVLKSTLRFFESTPTGRIVNRFTKDLEATEDSIPQSIKSLIDCFMNLIKMIFIISMSTPLFIIALIPITIAYLLVQRYFVPSNRQLKRMQSVSKSPIFSHFSETQSGISTIRAYNLEKQFIQIMQNNIDENLVLSYTNTVSNRWLALRLEIIGSLITIFAALFAIFSRDTLTAGLAGLSISTSLNVSSTLNWLVRAVSEFEVNITSIERIKEYFDIKHEPEWTSNTNNKPNNDWPSKGEIVFKDYSIKYRQDLDNVLNKINAHIRPNEKIGIVGRTGAGKSSLTLGLFRMLELYDGNILIDDININEIGLHDLRHKLTIIPQDPIIFSGTIKWNLDPFGYYNDKQLWLALENSHLKEYVLNLDKQLDFECNEGGDNFRFVIFIYLLIFYLGT
jgi:ABC-type multidrug transport system fused ATPase/permease subunit